MPISKLLLAVVPALALLPATVRTNRGPAPLRTATLETVVEPPEEPRVLGQPRLLGQREFVPYDGPRYAPYDPELE